MPDLWDTNPDHVFGTPGKQPDPTPNGNNDHTKEVRLRGPRSVTLPGCAGEARFIQWIWMRCWRRPSPWSRRT
jgi:hypothetical protein